MIKLQTIKRQQTLVDYVVQNAGALDYLFDIASLNGISITEQVQPGTVLKVVENDVRVPKMFSTMLIDIISPVRTKGILKGIGYMQIGTNFKVS